MPIVALTHTEGVVLNNTYFVLELAYQDILGIHQHFLIQSPVSFKTARKFNEHLNCSLEVIMCTYGEFKHRKVYKMSEILHFLNFRYALLKHYYGSNILFGYKGRSFQKNILEQCNIPNINIERFGIPSIKTLMFYYPNIKRNCVYHIYDSNKCAEHILRLINEYFNEKYK